MDEAVAWVKRCPNPMPGPSKIEIRPLYEMADCNDTLTPEVTEIHDRTGEKLSGIGKGGPNMASARGSPHGRPARSAVVRCNYGFSESCSERFQ